MKIFHKFFLCVLIVIMTFSNVNVLSSDEEKYIIADVSSGLKEIVSSFSEEDEAINFYNRKLKEYDNLVLYHNEEVVDMEYGVVEFKTSENCLMNLTYTSLYNGETSYINACFGVDGAYLGRRNGNVYFKISGDVGYTSCDNVKLRPYDLLDVRLSAYEMKDSILYHNIKTSLDDDYYIYSIELDSNDYWQGLNGSLYSYDGNYFYDDFYKMIDDYKKDVYDNALNKDNPYYNYYLYLPYRSYTNYSYDEINKYFSDVLGINGKITYYDDLNKDGANDCVNLSQYYGELDSFFGYESIYGANALMMLSESTLESSYGKSLSAFSKNNLFSHAAYDSEIERETLRYNNIETSVYGHAKYFVSRSYTGVHLNLYNGSFFGNKLSGVNVSQSSDPYWGEKCASNYFKYDNSLGLKDKNSYALGIVNNRESFNIYKDEELLKVAYEVNNIETYSIILLEDLGNVYKIQLESSTIDDYKYDPELCVGYIAKRLVDHVINEEMISEKKYQEVNYDFDGGLLHGDSALTIKTVKNQKDAMPAPIKEGYEFVGYKNISGIVKAQYRQIKTIEVNNAFSNVIEKGGVYNLKDGKLKVIYNGNFYQIFDINSNMIESFNTNDDTCQNITINYNGIKIEYPIEISKKLKDNRDLLDIMIKDRLDKNDIDNLKYIKENLDSVNYLLDFDEIRYLDNLLLNNTKEKVSYHFMDSKYDISVSGLALALEDPKATDSFKPVKDTYYIRTKNISKSSKTKIKKYSDAYGFSICDGFNISLSLNLKHIEIGNPIVVSINLKDKNQDKIYTVYHIDKDGNIIKCRTIQSENYVSFITRSTGDFMILEKDSFNNYDIIDNYENLCPIDNDPDPHSLFMEGYMLLFFGVYGYIMSIIYTLSKKERNKVWNVYKR